jgi:hypothetical protein
MEPVWISRIWTPDMITARFWRFLFLPAALPPPTAGPFDNRIGEVSPPAGAKVADNSGQLTNGILREEYGPSDTHLHPVILGS